MAERTVEERVWSAVDALPLADDFDEGDYADAIAELMQEIDKCSSILDALDATMDRPTTGPRKAAEELRELHNCFQELATAASNLSAPAKEELRRNMNDCCDWDIDGYWVKSAFPGLPRAINAAIENLDARKDGGGAPRKDKPFGLALAAARWFERLCDKPPAVAYRRVSAGSYGQRTQQEPYGAFLDFVRALFEAADLSDSPVSRARAAERVMRKTRGAQGE